MKKYIFVLNALELMSKLYVGKRVEGVLFMDENTGRRLIPQGCGHGPRDGTAGGADARREECADREGVGPYRILLKHYSKLRIEN